VIRKEVKTMANINTFEDLEIWKRGCQLAIDVYSTNQTSKDFGIKDQMQRSAISIPSNIAEGCGRGSTSEFIKFLRYSKSFCRELTTQLLIAERVRKKLNQPILDGSSEMINETKELSKMIQDLINSLNRRSHS
jgi:four helix bundle protein